VSAIEILIVLEKSRDNNQIPIYKIDRQLHNDRIDSSGEAWSGTVILKTGLRVGNSLVWYFGPNSNINSSMTYIKEIFLIRE